jgi:uncharacterized protein
MIFVDTGAWFASFVPGDLDHASAARWLTLNTDPLLTTDFVVDETLTLLKARGESRRALRSADDFFLGQLASLYFLTEDDIREAWHLVTRTRTGASPTAPRRW